MKYRDAHLIYSAERCFISSCSRRITALFDYFMDSSSWSLHFIALGSFYPRRTRKVLKVDRFEVAETGVSFLLIIARLSETLEVTEVFF
jgi:hypothetical protein